MPCSRCRRPAIPHGTFESARSHEPSPCFRTARQISRFFAAARASVLLDDHLRVREASRATGSTSVQASPRPDVIGVYVLLPRVD